MGDDRDNQTKGKAVPIRWAGLESVPVSFSNNMLVQHTEHEFILVFGYLQPPIILSEHDVEAVESVVSTAVARIAIAPTRMPELIRALSDNYDRYMRRAKDAADETEGE